MIRAIPLQVVSLVGALFLAACPNTEGYVYTETDTTETGTPVGSACTLDSECGENLRCQGGICSTGACQGDDDCREGELCVFGECTPDTEFECRAGQAPILDINPPEMDFGAVSVGGSATRSIVIRNLGSCLLTLQGVGKSSTTPADFVCERCAVSNFPKRIPPNRSYEITVVFSPTSPGNRDGILEVRSDDESYPIQQVPMNGRYEGTPRLLVEPETLDFGFQTAATAITRKVRLSNVGEGNAVLRITDVRLASPGLMGFTFTPEIQAPSGTVTLTPTVAGSTDCLTTGGCVDLDVTFTPPGYATYQNDLVITYDPPPTTGLPYVRVGLKGYSTTPPELRLSDSVVDFGDRQVGMAVDYQVVSVFNDGQTPMTVQITISPLSSTDFRTEAPLPLELPVPPGGYARLKVHYEPTELGQVAGEVRVATNDPNIYNAAFGTGTKTIAIRGNGTPSTFNDILKVEMTYENGDSGFFGNDFRNVNLIFESPFGDICTQPTYGASAPGAPLQIVSDPCAIWPMSGDSAFAGTPRWIAIGAGQEPERVILNNAGAATSFPLPYVVSASYEEDCASIPSGLVAGLLGISVDALVGYISGGSINLGGGEIADFIQEMCWDHASSTATITVFINGAAALNCSKTLGAKGITLPVAEITRTNGMFEARCR